MSTENNIKKLENKIDDLTELVKTLIDQQKNQYTDIMLRINDNNESIKLLTGEKEVLISPEEQYKAARAAVIKNGKASTSFIQRKLQIGYSAACVIIDRLEKEGVIGPREGAKMRRVYG